ncbi:MAG: SCP2 sterol-binding domain-containing protein [Pseudomonadota bacterium]
MPTFLPPWLISAAVPRLTLFLNHVLASEPAATAKLQPHAGRRLLFDLQGPTGWPALPPLVLRITPAGLFDSDLSDDDGSLADLQVRMDASKPLSLLKDGAAGQRPPVDISGDAALAADVSWLFEHLRWDLEDDLAPWVGPVVAREAVRIGGFLATGLRQAVGSLATLAGRQGRPPASSA